MASGWEVFVMARVVVTGADEFVVAFVDGFGVTVVGGFVVTVGAAVVGTTVAGAGVAGISVGDGVSTGNAVSVVPGAGRAFPAF
jgi:hypothetical protein